jgi:hypothetical protein
MAHRCSRRTCLGRYSQHLVIRQLFQSCEHLASCLAKFWCFFNGGVDGACYPPRSHELVLVRSWPSSIHASCRRRRYRSRKRVKRYSQQNLTTSLFLKHHAYSVSFVPEENPAVTSLSSMARQSIQPRPVFSWSMQVVVGRLEAERLRLSLSSLIISPCARSCSFRSSFTD